MILSFSSAMLAPHFIHIHHDPKPARVFQAPTGLILPFVLVSLVRPVHLAQRTQAAHQPGWLVPQAACLRQGMPLLALPGQNQLRRRRGFGIFPGLRRRQD
jgi:hypothetical protein